MEAGNCPTLNMNAMQNYLLSQPLSSFHRFGNMSMGTLIHQQVFRFPLCTSHGSPPGRAYLMCFTQVLDQAHGELMYTTLCLCPPDVLLRGPLQEGPIWGALHRFWTKPGTSCTPPSVCVPLMHSSWAPSMMAYSKCSSLVLIQIHRGHLYTTMCLCSPYALRMGHLQEGPIGSVFLKLRIKFMGNSCTPPSVRVLPMHFSWAPSR